MAVPGSTGLCAGGSVPAYIGARARLCRESLVFGRYTFASEPLRPTSLAHDGGIAAGDIFRIGFDGKVVVEQGDGLQVSGIQATPSEGSPRAYPPPIMTACSEKEDRS